MLFKVKKKPLVEQPSPSTIYARHIDETSSNIQVERSTHKILNGEETTRINHLND